MGLFSKKTYVCQRCGKEFEARLSSDMCMDCYGKIQRKRQEIAGYEFYRKMASLPELCEDEWQAVIDHRTQIMEKYRDTYGITREELQQVSDNYKNLSDSECQNILKRVQHSCISEAMGAGRAGQLYFLAGYDKTVVDVKDIFAVGYTTAYRGSDSRIEMILCAVFTNDPYIPVFPVVYAGTIGMFAISKSKKGREGVTALFELSCPNLQYPVSELKQLKKVIQSEGLVKGNIEKEQMLTMISNAIDNRKLFAPKEISEIIPHDTVEMVGEYGYHKEQEIRDILKMDKMLNGRFWRKQMERMN